LSLGGYGTATCPLIAGNLVVVIRDRDEGSSLLAVDLRTGKKVWEPLVRIRMEALERPSPGRMPVWMKWSAGITRLKGYALKTGKRIGMVEGVPAFACTTPVTGEGCSTLEPGPMAKQTILADVGPVPRKA